MAWQFEEQEADKIRFAQTQRVSLDPASVKAQRNMIRFSYIDGFNSAHGQWINEVKAFLKEQGADDQVLRQVRDVVTALETMQKVLTKHVSRNVPCP